MDKIAFAAGKLYGFLTQWRAIGLLAVCAALVWLGLRGTPDGRLHIFFLDVGQGDAIFIRAPDGQQILVDGGPSTEELLSEIGDISPFWNKSLDLVVLTHPDTDHMTGLLAIPERYSIGQVLDTQTAQQSADATAWNQVLAATNASRIMAEPGMQLRTGDIVLTVLRAPESDGASPPGDNATSLVLRLDYGQTSALLTGDAPQAVEEEMLNTGQPVDVDILKVGHHGSAGSTSEAFIAAVSPQYAVIQVGANNYGHPAPAVLDRLHNVTVLRTDLYGRIEAVSDGAGWQVKPQRRP